MKIKNQFSITEEGLCWNILCLKHNIDNFARCWLNYFQASEHCVVSCLLATSVPAPDISVLMAPPAQIYKISPLSPQLSPTECNLDIRVQHRHSA